MMAPIEAMRSTVLCVTMRPSEERRGSEGMDDEAKIDTAERIVTGINRSAIESSGGITECVWHETSRNGRVDYGKLPQQSGKRDVW